VNPSRIAELGLYSVGLHRLRQSFDLFDHGDDQQARCPNAGGLILCNRLRDSEPFSSKIGDEKGTLMCRLLSVLVVLKLSDPQKA
jgi:hypothetical protein